MDISSFDRLRMNGYNGLGMSNTLMQDSKYKAVVWGAGGFVGGELLRLILGHPNLCLDAALSNTNAGKKIGDVYPNLAPWTELTFKTEFDWAEMKKGRWALFSVLAHGDAMKEIPKILDKISGADVKLVDLSGDFRLQSAESYQDYYGHEHVAKEYLKEFVYGLPEMNRRRIAESGRVSNPGCMATGAALSILPLASERIPVRFIAIDSKTGSSGAGARPKETTHHPNRMNNFRAYLPLAHQHIPEIESSWISSGGSKEVPISFVPQMAPMVRGIFTTAHIFVDGPVSDVRQLYEKYYSSSPFVRIVDTSPTIVDVWGTNRCDISITAKGERVLICTAIDNLVKGAAGQALQNMNIMNGWNETTGLLTPPPTPV